ncbi:fatty acid-binding protein 1-like isoform X1 [Manduca sexta]|uniref:fatty acid-binding protein 1-like isoform X1 n=1 Tax=Manduca sexta TaxID=7130 RepID=UPI00188FD536|nr:fatty acid-binding protein 1-like isoform X1 [Manduca sexta]
MAYEGKVYTFDRQENVDELFRRMGVTDEEVIKKYATFKSTAQLKKEGNKYRYITKSCDGNNEVLFESGVEVDDVGLGGVPIKSVYTVNGNTVTQVVKGSEGKGAVIREFSEDLLKMTLTTDSPDFVAYRYYKA